MIFRQVRADVPDAQRLLTEYFAERARGFPGGTYKTVFPDPEAFVAPQGVFLLVEGEDGGAVGCGAIRRIEDGAVAGGPSGIRYEVKHLYLQPHSRQRGWGNLLLAELERRARLFGAGSLVLDTHHSLEAAGSLYARAGFELIEPYNQNPNATRWWGKRLE